jgi:pimeloyl-ACP methyl ester carboxylesterase
MLYVREAGSAGAPAIVFLHGTGLSSRMWQPQFDRLRDYHCLAPDLPEQGRSAHIGPFRLDTAADAVADIIRERVPSGRAHVVGISLGGAVALTLLQRAPHCVDYMFVSGASARIGHILGAVSYATQYLYPHLPPESVVASIIRQCEIPPDYHALLHDDILISLNRAFIAHYTRALMSLEMPTQATAPLLVVTGARETLLVHSMARKLTKTVKGTCSFVVPGMAHVWNLQAPDMFTDVLRAWISDDPLAQTWLPLQYEAV